MSEKNEVPILTAAMSGQMISSCATGKFAMFEVAQHAAMIAVADGRAIVISAERLAELERDAARYRWLRYHLLIVDLDGKEPTAADNERFDKTIAITGAKP